MTKHTLLPMEDPDDGKITVKDAGWAGVVLTVSEAYGRRRRKARVLLNLTDQRDLCALLEDVYNEQLKANRP